MACHIRSLTSRPIAILRPRPIMISNYMQNTGGNSTISSSSHAFLHKSCTPFRISPHQIYESTYVRNKFPKTQDPRLLICVGMSQSSDPPSSSEEKQIEEVEPKKAENIVKNIEENSTQEVGGVIKNESEVSAQKADDVSVKNIAENSTKEVQEAEVQTIGEVIPQEVQEAEVQTIGEVIPQEVSELNEQYDQLFRSMEVECRSADPAVLRSYSKFIATTANHLQITCDKMEFPRYHVRRWTVLKSAFVHKKHRVQYEVRTHYLIMRFLRLTSSTADTFLEYIQRNLPEGVSMRVTKEELMKLPEFVIGSEKVAPRNA